MYKEANVLDNKKYSISLGSVVNGVPKSLVSNPLFKGKLDIVQVCPQNKCIVDNDFIKVLKNIVPKSEIRLHANISLMNIKEFRSLTRLPMCHVDLSTYHNTDFDFYWNKLVKVLQFNGNPYTLHAGLKSKCTLSKMIDNVKDLQDRSGVKVGVEGMYPTHSFLKKASMGFLMASLNDYRKVMDAGIFYAIDLSHINIIKHQISRSFDIEIIKDLIYHDNCIEVHISSNNGISDTHEPLNSNQWWLPLINNKIRCPIISEERKYLK